MYKAKRPTLLHTVVVSGTVYKVCPTCSKHRPESCGQTAGDGQRWYCSERCLDRGEAAYRGNGKRK